jgi:hypothetical protein
MFYTVAAAAEAIGLSKSTILGAIESGLRRNKAALCAGEIQSIIDGMRIRLPDMSNYCCPGRRDHKTGPRPFRLHSQPTGEF